MNHILLVAGFVFGLSASFGAGAAEVGVGVGDADTRAVGVDVGDAGSAGGGLVASPLAECGSLADRQLKTVLQSVAFPPEYIQVGLIDRIERTDFKNATPGTYDQEYVGTYRLKYRASQYANFAEQVISVRFVSPFICEGLKVWCLTVDSSLAAEDGDLSSFPKTGPLACPR